MDNGKEAQGWTRHELNLRLTKRRLAQLRALAAQLPGQPTPTEAIDAALAHASDTEGPLMARIDEVEASIELHAAARRQAGSGLEGDSEVPCRPSRLDIGSFRGPGGGLNFARRDHRKAVGER
jgi:hypothetical protein